MDGELNMPKYQQDDDQISDGVNLLISILVRYPEIGTINFNQEKNSLKFTFMLSGIPSSHEFAAIKMHLLNSIDVYHMLECSEAWRADIQLTTHEQVAMLIVVRDVHTLSKGEIALLITLLREKFRDMLVVDCNDSMMEEDLLVQEELIDNMLENVKQHRTERSLIGFREDGRVMVFNK